VKKMSKMSFSDVDDGKSAAKTGRINISTGTKWEGLAGYSRAVRIGNVVEVAGTTAVNEEGTIMGINDVEQQTRFIFQRIKKSLEQAGASMADVIRTRMFVTDITYWEVVSRLHGEVFRDIRPACTLLEVSKLIQPELLIEIEATAILSPE